MARVLAIALVLSAAAASSRTQDLRLPPVLSDHVVFQRGAPLRLWGKATKGEEVRARSSWGHEASSRAGDDGSFELHLEPPAEAGPHEITVTCPGNAHILNDVWFGEVWVCGGQSNMEWTLGPDVGEGIADWEKEVASADFPQIRLFKVPKTTSAVPLEECGGEWRVCTPGDAKTFSAVAFLFGRELHRALGVPVGLIQSCWGGTLCEAWTPEGTLVQLGGFDEGLAKLRAARAPRKDGEGSERPPALGANTPTVLYNAMIAPLAHLRVSGAIFYQGEANVGAPLVYRRLFPAMIGAWRTTFGMPRLPFYYAQIAPYDYGKHNELAGYLREAQAMAMQACPEVGMAVTVDVGDPKDIHPLNKQDVGKRLAMWALARAYGKSGVDPLGPTYAEHSVAGDSVRVVFTHAEGLTTKDGGAPVNFMVAGEDRVFQPATARIEGTAVLVRSDAVAKPVAVRYAFNGPEAGNLVDGKGLPASCFRTDDWPPR